MISSFKILLKLRLLKFIDIKKLLLNVNVTTANNINYLSANSQVAQHKRKMQNQ